METYDVNIIGTEVDALEPTGKRILILERGRFLTDEHEN